MPEWATLGWEGAVQVIVAIGALGTAAFGLVDASKALGLAANIGYRHLRDCVGLFDGALTRALGAKGDWRALVHAHWLNGRSRAEQKAIIKSLIRLGLAEETAEAVSLTTHVDPNDLKRAAAKLTSGAELSMQEVNLLARVDAAVDAHLDAAFDRAEQAYRNGARAWAGLVAVLLSFAAVGLIEGGLDAHSAALALLIGLLAVPLAPVAKDLASSLSSAARAYKAAKGAP